MAEQSRGSRPARRQVLVAVAALVVLVLGVVAVVVVRRGPAGTGRLSSRFTTTGLGGGGFQNVVAIAPGGSGTVLSGGDVSGVNRSTDRGLHYQVSNEGLSSEATDSAAKVATLAYHPTARGTVYAGVGQQGTTGGFYRSTDDGRTWTRRSDVPRFSGNNNRGVDGLPTPHPRSTGNLIAVDPASGAIWVATFNDGVMRSTDDGATWTTLGLAGTYLRSLALDPSDPDVVYAAGYGKGVWKTTSARGEGTFSALAGSPAHVEELLALPGAVYAAAGPEGVFASTDGGATWTPSGDGALPVNGTTQWTAIAGYRDGPSTVLFAGCLKPVKLDGSRRFATVFKSADGGATWAPLTARSEVSYEVLGSDEEWWMASAWRSAMLDKSAATVGSIAIDPSDHGTVFVSGRGGLWRSTDGGRTWQPSVNGMGVTVNDRILADPRVPGRVYVANTDYRLLYSTSGLARVLSNKPRGAGTMGTDLALDTATRPSTVYLATGHRDTNTRGEIWSNPNPAKSRDWTPEGLAEAAGGKRPLAVAVRRVDGRPVLLAAVEGGGIWRKSGPAWTKVDDKAMTGPQGSANASFSWPSGSATVYLYDRASGVWRSNDAGRTWVEIWARPSNQRRAHTGFVAAAQDDPDTLYVSVGDDGVYRLDHAPSGTVGHGLTPVRVGGFAKPGAITVDRAGRLWVADLVAGSGAARLSYSPDRGRRWVEMSNDVYRAAAALPAAIDVAPEGHVYVALAQNGALRS